MKYLFIIVLFSLSSCITITTSSSGFKDEIYFSSDDYIENKKEQTSFQSTQADESVEDDIEYYSDDYDSDDYYDYGYASRIRRFHSPFIGFGYYHNYYTNSYWYNYNPFDYGLSIYYGYNFWSPGYYDPFYHYSYGYPLGFHNNYYHHYHHHHNYYAGFTYPTYFNSFDNNSVHYGPRQNFNIQKTPESFANRFVSQQSKIPAHNLSKPTNISRPLNSSTINNSKPSVKVNGNQNFNLNNSKPHTDKKPNNFTSPSNKVKPSNIYNKPIRNNKPTNSYNKPVRNNKPSDSYKKPIRNNKPTQSYSKPVRTPSFKSNSSPSRPSRSQGNNSRRPR